MAARKNTRIDQKSRDKIQASQLVNRLNKHALADEEIMSSSQIRAAEILLKKTLPDLTTTELHADVKAEVTHKITITPI